MTTEISIPGTDAEGRIPIGARVCKSSMGDRVGVVVASGVFTTVSKKKSDHMHITAVLWPSLYSDGEPRIELEFSSNLYPAPTEDMGPALESLRDSLWPPARTRKEGEG